MSLSKKSTFDYEIRGDYRCVQIREKIAIIEDGEELSYKYNRRSLMPDNDISSESSEVKAICNAVWTDEIKKAYQDSLKED